MGLPQKRLTNDDGIVLSMETMGHWNFDPLDDSGMVVNVCLSDLRTFSRL